MYVAPKKPAPTSENTQPANNTTNSTTNNTANEATDKTTNSTTNNATNSATKKGTSSTSNNTTNSTTNNATNSTSNNATSSTTIKASITRRKSKAPPVTNNDDQTTASDSHNSNKKVYVAENVPRETSTSRYTRDTTSSSVRSTSVPKMRPSSNTATAAAIGGPNLKYALYIPTHTYKHTYIHDFFEFAFITENNNKITNTHT